MLRYQRHYADLYIFRFHYMILRITVRDFLTIKICTAFKWIVKLVSFYKDPSRSSTLPLKQTVTIIKPQYICF